MADESKYYLKNVDFLRELNICRKNNSFDKKMFNEKNEPLKFENTEDYWFNETVDEFGNVVKFENSEGYWWTSEYDEHGNETSFRNSDGDWWLKTYDDKGNLLSHKHSSFKVHDKLAEYFLLLSTRIASSKNCRKSIYLDDMIQDGVTMCIRYAHNFDSTRSSNPVAYFTTFVINAFKSHFNKEKIQKSLKLGVERPPNLIENSVTKQKDDCNNYLNFPVIYAKHNQFIREIEKTREEEEKEKERHLREGTKPFYTVHRTRNKRVAKNVPPKVKKKKRRELDF